jgi:hypothetical protein
MTVSENWHRLRADAFDALPRHGSERQSQRHGRPLSIYGRIWRRVHGRARRRIQSPMGEVPRQPSGERNRIHNIVAESGPGKTLGAPLHIFRSELDF